MCVFTRGGTEGRRGRPTSPSRRLSPPRRSVRLPFPVIFWQVSGYNSVESQTVNGDGKPCLARGNSAASPTSRALLVVRSGLGPRWVSYVSRSTQSSLILRPDRPHQQPNLQHTHVSPESSYIYRASSSLSSTSSRTVTQVPILRHPSLSPPTHAPPAACICAPHTRADRLQPACDRRSEGCTCGAGPQDNLA